MTRLRAPAAAWVELVEDPVFNFFNAKAGEFPG
jgi:hypothetical protein